MPKPVSKKIIAVDIDEVIFPMTTDLIAYLDREHSAKLTQADFVTYHFEDVWPGGSDEGKLIFEKYKAQAGVEIAPLKGAAEALAELSRNYELVIMTARDQVVSRQTMEWITHHFPEQFKDVHFLGNRHDSKTWRSKGEVCNELGIPFLIDDNLKTILEADAKGVKAILFGDYPWNRTDRLPPKVTRVKNWEEVLGYFNAAGQ